MRLYDEAGHTFLGWISFQLIEFGVEILPFWDWIVVICLTQVAIFDSLNTEFEGFGPISSFLGGLFISSVVGSVKLYLVELL